VERHASISREVAWQRIHQRHRNAQVFNFEFGRVEVMLVGAAMTVYQVMSKPQPIAPLT
jgi:hypothetical protein